MARGLTLVAATALALPGCAALLGGEGGGASGGGDLVDVLLESGQAAVSGFIPALAVAIGVLRKVRRSRQEAADEPSRAQPTVDHHSQEIAALRLEFGRLWELLLVVVGKRMDREAGP